MLPATQKIEGKGDWPSRLLFWRQISQCLTSCPQQIAVPFHVWLFHLFLRCTIWRLTELFHAILCHLISCSTIWQKAKLFHASLRRLMLCCTIWHYSVLFEHWELAHFTFDWTILQMSAGLFAFWLDCLTISSPALTCVASPFMFWLDCFRLSCSITAKKAEQFVLWLNQLLIVCAIL